MSLLTINANFTKRVREPHKKATLITKGIVGIRISGVEWPRDERFIRLTITSQYKPGHGWMLGGYHVVKIEEDPISVV